jgi:hypothetical protein
MNKANTTKDSTELQSQEVLVNGKPLNVILLQDIPDDNVQIMIPLATLRRIIADAKYDTADTSDIKTAFIRKLRDDVHSMPEYVSALNDEHSFHHVVNILANCTVAPQDVDNKPSTAVVGRIDLAQ